MCKGRERVKPLPGWWLVAGSRCRKLLRIGQAILSVFWRSYYGCVSNRCTSRLDRYNLVATGSTKQGVLLYRLVASWTDHDLFPFLIFRHQVDLDYATCDVIITDLCHLRNEFL